MRTIDTCMYRFFLLLRNDANLSAGICDTHNLEIYFRSELLINVTDDFLIQ